MESSVTHANIYDFEIIDFEILSFHWDEMEQVLNKLPTFSFFPDTRNAWTFLFPDIYCRTIELSVIKHSMCRRLFNPFVSSLFACRNCFAPRIRVPPPKIVKYPQYFHHRWLIFPFTSHLRTQAFVGYDLLPEKFLYIENAGFCISCVCPSTRKATAH